MAKLKTEKMLNDSSPDVRGLGGSLRMSPLKKMTTKKVNHGIDNIDSGNDSEGSKRE